MKRLIPVLVLPVLWTCGTKAPFDQSQSHAESATHPPVEARLGETFALRIGQEARIRSESLILLFQAVPEDSRCPEEEWVDCVWEGNAEVKIEMVKPARMREEITLNTTLEPKRSSYLEYEVQLLSLGPPRPASVPPDPERYEADFVVFKP